MKNSTVLIVGAGPTGLTLACDLRTRGIDVLVIDKATGPATTSRALGLQARGVRRARKCGGWSYGCTQRSMGKMCLRKHFAGAE